jgi:phage tail-like protein
LEGDLPGEGANLAAPDGPAGIAVDLDGTIYFSDSIGHRLLKIDECDQTMAPLPCIGGKDGRPTQLNTPRGLLIPKHRRSLFVADSANHRIQIFDLASLQLVDIWGQVDLAGKPQPGTEPGRFNTPWTLAGDSEGNVYMVDYGNHRVQKFNALGEVVPDFWDNVKKKGLRNPGDIAAGAVGENTHLYIVARDTNTAWKVFVFDTEGNPVSDKEGRSITFGPEHFKPMGIAVTEDAIYVGDNDLRRVLKFKKGDDYSLVGEAIGYQGPVAALALDDKGHLLVHTGTSLAPVRLALTRGYRTKGILWSTAIKSANPKVIWHRLQAEVNRLGPNAHLQFFLHTSDNDADPPTVNPGSNTPFADPKWRPMPLDAMDLFIGGDPACCLWIGAQFSGDGASTPVVTQMRAEFDHETYLSHLPAIYSNNVPSRDFLIRFLSLFESFFGEVESEITDLAALFDPAAVPTEFLPWLAGWLALNLNEEWDEKTKRRAIAQAFAAYARRGTAEGLRESLRLYGGVHATIIEEPILNAAWWSLPAPKETPGITHGSTGESWQATENSVLGFTTMLASAQVQGAVVGTSAILDQSHLITNEEFGAPLFEDLAHQFSVEVYSGELKCAETLTKVRTVIEREKPAHTTYHLCIIEPRMRVGFQARVGIDAVVAGPLPAIKLGETLGDSITLGGDPAGRIGERSQVGQTMRVG